MATVKDALNWFEIPVADYDRGKAFYEAIFEYEMTEMEMGDQKMAFFQSDHENGVGGGISHGEGAVPSSSGTTVYLNGGNDLSVILDRVEGKILLPKTQITPEIGYMAFFQDTEGNRVGLHSPN